MAESVVHRQLVDLLVNYIVENNEDVGRSDVLIDNVDKGLELHNGVHPDVYCQTSIQTIIGEAKIGTDIVNDHTAKQFESYLEWCWHKIDCDGSEATIVYAVPSEYCKTAENYLGDLLHKKIEKDAKRGCDYNQVRVVVKTPMGQRFNTADEGGQSSIAFRNEKPIVAKIEAFDYQKRAFNTIKDMEYAAIFHEQGLGKTKIAIDLMIYWFQKKIVDTVVIATKKSLIVNWKRELEKHVDVSYAVVSTKLKDNFLIFNGAYRIILVNFEAFAKEEERFDMFTGSRPTGIIIDESAKIKNPKSKITQSFLKLAPGFNRRVIMSGTPIANRPYDIWSQVYFLDQGKSLGSDFEKFKRENDLTNDLGRSKEKQKAFVESVSSIFESISSFTIRETKSSGIIKLPPKEYYTINLPFEIKQKKIYDSVKTELSHEILRDGVFVEDDLSEVIKRLTRLIEVTSNPKLVDESYDMIPAKMDALLRLLEEINERDEKVIVWTAFIGNVSMIKQHTSKYNPVCITGSMSSEERDGSVQQFLNNSDVKILIATNAAKEGLTLTVANNAIFYDRTLNLDDYLQAQDRIHRISQVETCHIYNLRIEGSIDEWVDKLVSCKDLSAKLAQGDITKEEFESTIDYSFGELIHEILCGE